MVAQTGTPTEVRGRVLPELIPKYQALLEEGYTSSEIAREGIRSLYRKLNTEKTQEATA